MTAAYFSAIVAPMEHKTHDLSRIPGCSKPLAGCAIVAVLAVLLVLGALVYLMRTPAVRDTLQCRSNLVELGKALQRYHDVNGRYPAALDELRKEYLKDPGILHCPLDLERAGYRYRRPGPNAPDNFVVLQCDRHRLRPEVPQTVLNLHRDGTLSAHTAKPRPKSSGGN